MPSTWESAEIMGEVDQARDIWTFSDHDGGTVTRSAVAALIR